MRGTFSAVQIISSGWEIAHLIKEDDWDAGQVLLVSAAVVDFGTGVVELNSAIRNTNLGATKWGKILGPLGVGMEGVRATGYLLKYASADSDIAKE